MMKKLFTNSKPRRLMNYLISVGSSYVEKGNYNNYKFFSVKSSREYSNNSNFIKLHNSFGSLNYSFPPERYLICCIQRRCLHMHPSRGLIQGEIQRQPDQKDSEVMETLREETQNLIHEIRNELSKKEAMKEIATYYFDGKGKCFRPLITLLMSKTINNHLELDQQVLASQREIAKIAEMVHASSLLHDDVIDGSDIRRGKPTVHSLYSHKRAVIAGDFVLSVAAAMAARLRDEKILILLSQVLVDLVQGEFMQLGSKEKENERFNHYLKKSFNKTASLISFSCKAVAHLANASEDIMEIAFQYGKNCGIAFQLIDDMLDFTSTATSLGKPNLNDLKSGLATAPVLFACEKFPELNSMIMRRFQEPDDVSKALDYVIKSDGLEQTKFLALKHCQEAMRQISFLKPCPEQRGLILLTNDVVNRLK